LSGRQSTPQPPDLAADLATRAKITQTLIRSRLLTIQVADKSQQLFGCLHATLYQFHKKVICQLHIKHEGGMTQGKCGSSNLIQADSILADLAEG